MPDEFARQQIFGDRCFVGGKIGPDGVDVTITGTLTNSNLISGTGRINAQLLNSTTGEVRVAAGESLLFTGSSNSNSGRIEVIGSAVAPAEIEFDGVVTNEEADGEIFARNATLRFNGGLIH